MMVNGPSPSVAAASVAGAAAALYAQAPSLQPWQVEKRLKETVKSLGPAVPGMLDVFEALFNGTFQTTATNPNDTGYWSGSGCKFVTGAASAPFAFGSQDDKGFVYCDGPADISKSITIPPGAGDVEVTLQWAGMGNFPSLIGTPAWMGGAFEFEVEKVGGSAANSTTFDIFSSASDVAPITDTPTDPTNFVWTNWSSSLPDFILEEDSTYNMTIRMFGAETNNFLLLDDVKVMRSE